MYYINDSMKRMDIILIIMQNNDDQKINSLTISIYKPYI